MSKLIKISAASARQKFNGCDPDYIRDVCHARCCESSTHPLGIVVTIHPSEEAAIKELGARVVDGLLQPKPGCKKCPFKTAENLCGIHFTKAKPFGCIASPFTLNGSGTLIVRNRYRLLKCFNDGKRLPAYVAFRASLDLILGAEESARVCRHLAAGGGDIMATVTDQVYERLVTNDQIKHMAIKKEKAPQHVKGVLMTSDSGNDPRYYAKKQAVERAIGRTLTTEEFQRDYYTGPDSYESGTSIFDPVLCELVYRWFTPAGGSVLDPFAGGSVRGIVAAKLGRHYTGIELRPEQIAANREQAKRIIAPPAAGKKRQSAAGAQAAGSAPAAGEVMPVWVEGDSTDAPLLAPGNYDLLFSCHPYADLEVYSDDPRDLSTMKYDDFLAAYRRIIAQCVGLLKPNAFACFVVGDVRDKKGFYRNFTGDTVRAFLDAGMQLYNEAILVTQVGSLSIRVGKQFNLARKLGKTHQNVYVFYKGDAMAIRQFGDVEFGELPAAAASAAADAAPAAAAGAEEGAE